MIALGFIFQPLTLAQINRWAGTHDVDALERIVDVPAGNTQLLDAIKLGGPYGGGRFGWTAAETKSPDGSESFVVLTTPLTAEDVGEYVFKRAGGRLKLIPEDNPLGARIDHHSFDVRFDPPAGQVTIKDTVNLRVDPSPEPIIMRLSSEFQVSSVTGQSGQKIPFTQAGGTVFIARKPGKQDLTIQYAGKPDRPTYSASITDSEATLTNGIWYPMIARLPAPYEETVHGPKEWTTIGQGVKTKDVVQGEDHVVSYRVDLPVVWYSLATGPYRTVTVTEGSRTFWAASPRYTPEVLSAQAATYPAIISFYERFGAFPFSGYGALDSPGYGSGALEAYSYATYGGPFPEEDAHEPSHTWWGGIIDNTYLHSFWNESFADFSDQFFRRNAPIGNTAERREAFVDDGGTESSYDNLACGTAGVYSGPEASNIGYGKGAKVLQMLELLMGSADLTKAMHDWVAAQPKGTAAEWADFEKVAEKIRPDLHLQSFFSDWIDRPGHVELGASVGYAGGVVKVSLDWKGKPYRVPLQVILVYPDGHHYLQTFDVRGDASVSVNSAQKPSLVSIDPYRVLIRPINPNEKVLGLHDFTGLDQVVDPAHLDWKSGDNYTPERTAEFANKWLIGSPETWPELQPLFEKAGFKVSGSSLTYDGTTINLNHGIASAMVDLGDGKYCVISCGKSRIEPNPGRAYIGVFDDLGRFLRGKTHFKESGELTFRL